MENLARHLLSAGSRERGIRVALEAAKLLHKKGSFDRAVRLLEECAAGEADT